MSLGIRKKAEREDDQESQHDSAQDGEATCRADSGAVDTIPEETPCSRSVTPVAASNEQSCEHGSVPNADRDEARDNCRVAAVVRHG
jgi:hypothetical protein